MCAHLNRTGRGRRSPLVVALAVIAGLLLLGAAPTPAPPGPPSGADPARVPAAARAALPLIVDLTAQHCPELPPVWVVAQVQAESGWDDAATSSDGPGGAAGLLQFDQRNWMSAGGRPWPSDPPKPGAEITTAADHLRIAVPWICTNLRYITRHLAATGKPTTPLDAMLVCHIAGCGRVTGSASGVPAPGEAGCGARCTTLIGRYLDTVHSHVERFTARVPPPRPQSPAPQPPAPQPSAPQPPTPQPSAKPDMRPDVRPDAGPGAKPDPAAAPTPWTGGATGCKLDDPTSRGCLTGATRHGLDAAAATFGGWSKGPVIRSAGCWDAHAWNPRSDHPLGRACDLFATRAGTFATGSERDEGWQLAHWYQRNADRLKVKYLIWQGRYWAPGVADTGGWGRRYTGGGIYDIRDATGGHYDHVHVSFRE